MNKIQAKLLVKNAIKANVAISQEGTSYYDKLIGKPQINGIELTGNKTSKELLLQHLMIPLTNEDIENMFKEE